MDIISFDPNHVLCGRIARQRYRLTFGEWEYRAVEEVEIRTNIKGLEALQWAVEKLLDRLEEGLGDDEPARLVMTAPNGDTLICEDDEMERMDWLQKMLMSADLIAFEPSGHVIDLLAREG